MFLNNFLINLSKKLNNFINFFSNHYFFNFFKKINYFFDLFGTFLSSILNYVFLFLFLLLLLLHFNGIFFDISNFIYLFISDDSGSNFDLFED